MQNYDIIWPVWLASHVVSRVALMHFAVPFVCSPSVTTADNSTNNAILTILLMSWTSLAHYFSHSPIFVIKSRIVQAGYNAITVMSTIDEIKSRIDIVDLVSEAGVKLRHAGKNYTGFCPFHDNKHTPAFVIWPESGTWRCFGQCNEGGDIFKFVMKKEGVDFREAMQKLAARAGVEIQEYQRESPQQKEAYENLRKLLEDAVVFYRSHLFTNKDILAYLHEKRGLTDATIEIFGLGYAPPG